ncbi:unnamed protein product [Rotaria sp. Silwood2]|nr:unnamed protein product [Rotaria sp. Silwood2]
MSIENQLKTIKHVYSTVYHDEERCMQDATLLPINNAIVYPNNKILYKKSDNTIDFIDISRIDKSIFFDKGSNQDTVYDNVNQKYNLAKNKLNFNPDEYQLEMADSGDKFILNLIDDKLPTIIAISDIFPTYFDLGLCSKNSIPICLDYSRRTLDKLKHSGDITIASPTGNSLLHCISGKFTSGMKYVTIISGYTNTPLYRYIERRPIVTILDHEKKKIYVVSVPLDEFTIGQSTICLPVSITCLNDNGNQKLLIEIFSNTKSCDSCLPNLSQFAHDTITESINMINLNNKQKLANESSKVKELIRKLKRNTQELVDKIGLAISKRKQSSIRFNLAQLKKKETIRQNVQRAINMSYDDFTNLLEKLCDESGVLWLNLDYNNLILMLKAIKDNKIGKYLTEPVLSLINCRNGDFNIDSFTISLLLEQTAYERLDPIRPQQTTDIVTSLPVSATYEGLRTSSWFFPLIDKYKNLEIPYNLNWINEANDSDIAAFRIISRNTIATSSILRDLQLNIQPQDKNITWFLIYITLAAIDELVKQRKNDGDMNHFNDTFTINIRCLICNLLTYTASGNVPASFVWQLFSNNIRPDLPKENFEWGIYVRLIEYVEYSGWDLNKLKANLRALLCRLLNKIIIKATESFRESEAKLKKEKSNDHLIKMHKIYYPYYEKMVRYCKHIRDTNEPIENEKITEILNVLSEFNNRRYRVGSIHQLSMHLKKNFKNKIFIDQLINCILYKWDNYDKKYKLKLSEFVKKTFFNSSSDHEQELDVKSIQNRLDDFRLILIEERPTMLSMVNKEIQPITNYEEIQKLFTLIETSIQNKKKLSVEELKNLRTYFDDIYKNENKLWQPFNPFPQFIEENNLEIYFDNNANDTDNEKEKVEENQDIVLYKNIFKEHYYGIIEQIANDSSNMRLNSIIEYTAFNSIEEFITLAKFAGFGQTFEEIAHTVKIILHSLIINCKKSADVAELIVLKQFI